MAPGPAQVVPTFLAVVDHRPSFDVLTLAAPIGLPETGTPEGRGCDRDARDVLGPRRAAAVVSPPGRRALGAPSYEDAIEANGGPLSLDQWELVHHVAEVDREMQPFRQRSLHEIHPELSFHQLNGDRPLEHPCHTDEGRAERRALLVRKIPGIERALDADLVGVRRGDLLEAAAALWTARRVASKGVIRLPKVPEWDAKGLRMQYLR